MISAEEFLDILEKKDLLDPELVADLRRRVGQSMAPVSAALLAKRLVDKGHLSRKLAQRLLDRAESEEPEDADVPVKRPPDAKVKNGNLGLAPLEEEEEEEEEELAELEMTEEEDWGLQELDDDKPPVRIAPSTPVQPAAPIPTATPVPTAASVIPAAIPVPPAAPLVDGLEEIEDLGSTLDGLSAAAMGGEPLEGPLVGGRAGRRSRGRRIGRGGKGNNWDSALLLIGGGCLLLLIIVGVILFFVLSGRGADEMLAQAHEYYSQGSYTKAEDSYSQFLEKFPKHPAAGSARVKLSLTKMRLAMASDWPKALAVATTEIPLISGEETFAADARPELASMLPDIADGLANKAHSALDGKIADLAEESLALVEKYVPSSSRPQDRLQDIQTLIVLTRLEIVRGERLESTIDAMVKAAEEGRTKEAYDLRRALLKEYPILLDDASLSEAVRIVSKAEQAAVKTVEKRVDAVTDEPESKAIATIALAQRVARSSVSGVAEQRVFAVAGGAVYGLEASEGKVLWRRDVGFEKNIRGPQSPPTPISDRPGADPLLVSRARREVLRVEASTGKIRWRFPVAEEFDAHPVLFGNRVLIATLSGRLVSLDLESGNSAEYIQLPQPLRVGPSVDESRNTIYQVGEHSSLFVLSGTDRACNNVIYLGHEPGSIVVPPVRVSRYLLVCENDGVRDSVLKVLDLAPPAAENGEAPPIQVVQQVRLKGHVYTTPIVSSPQVLVVTNAGSVSVFRLTGNEGAEPLSLSAEGKTAGEEGTDLVRFASIVSGRLWIADSQLTQYAVRSSESRLRSNWIANEGSVSLQPPIVAGSAVIHVRHRRGMPGVIVSALNMEDKAVLWETTLASPTAGVPVLDVPTRTVIATTAVGGVFQVQPPADGQVAVRDDPTGTVPSAELTSPIEQVVRLANGTIAMIPGGEPLELPVFEPGKTPDAARLRSTALADPLSGQAIAFADGLLAPCRGGQVVLLDPRTGGELAAPFQPVLEAGRKYRWSRPAILGNDQFVIADDSGGLHRVVLKAEPVKQLAGAASVRLDEPVTSPIAALGDRIYAVDRSDSLVCVDLPGLTDKTRQSLGAKCVIGPVTLGDYVLLVTNDGLIHVIDSAGKLRSHSLAHGLPAGEPVVDGAHWLLASSEGTVWRIDPASGEELARLDTGLAMGSGLADYGRRLLAAGHDGTLYVIEKP